MERHDKTCEQGKGRDHQNHGLREHWSGRGESNSRFLLGREACHRNTTAASVRGAATFIGGRRASGA